MMVQPREEGLRVIHILLQPSFTPAWQDKPVSSPSCADSLCLLPLHGRRVLLKKLWAKMSEPDWRTVTKAVYLFHTILRNLPIEHHAVLKIFLGKVCHEVVAVYSNMHFLSSLADE